MESREFTGPGLLFEVDLAAKERLARGKAEHFTEIGGAERIARAVAILAENPPAYLSRVTTAELVRLVEDTDLE